MDVVVSIKTKSVAGGGTNQDRVVSFEHPQGVVVVVADGAGGSSGGDIAAQWLVTFVKGAALESELAPSICAELLTAADRALSAHAGGGYCTALVIVLGDETIFGASVGDSEAWLIDGEDCLHLTRKQRRKPLLGSAATTPVAFGPTPFAGTLVVGTDGLFKYAGRDAIIEAASDTDIARVCERLMRAAELPGGGLHDDTTVAVCRKPKDQSTGCRESVGV